MKLSDYILLSRDERTKHVDLTTDCELGKFERRSRGGLDDLFALIGVEDDIANWTNARIHCCHLCKCGRRRGECGNPRHIYIGTASENQFDEGTEFLHWRAKRAGRKKGGVNDKEKKKLFDELSQTEEFTLLSSRAAAEIIGVSHTAIQRWRRYSLSV